MIGPTLAQSGEEKEGAPLALVSLTRDRPPPYQAIFPSKTTSPLNSLSFISLSLSLSLSLIMQAMA